MNRDSHYDSYLLMAFSMKTTEFKYSSSAIGNCSQCRIDNPKHLPIMKSFERMEKLMSVSKNWMNRLLLIDIVLLFEYFK